MFVHEIDPRIIEAANNYWKDREGFLRVANKILEERGIDPRKGKHVSLKKQELLNTKFKKIDRTLNGNYI